MIEMELLYPQVEITPGSRGQDNWAGDRMQPMQGSTVLRVTNGDRDKTFTVHLYSLTPCWDKEWPMLQRFKVSKPTNSRVTVDPPDKDLVKGDLTFPAAPGERHDILICFDLDAIPASRAGRYDFKVEVTYVDDDGQTLNPSEKGIAIVHPFYQWDAELKPRKRRLEFLDRRSANRKLTFFRRRVDYDLKITNRSNDWLYCRFAPPTLPEGLRAEIPTTVGLEPPDADTRIALPPPGVKDWLAIGNNRQNVTQRSIRISGRGTPSLYGPPPQNGDPLPLTVQRVDAPSLPRPGAVNVLAVEVAGADDNKLVSDTKSLAKYPLVMQGRIRAMVFGALGLVLAFVMFHQLILARLLSVRTNLDIDPLQASVNEGEILRLKGHGLQFCKVWIIAVDEHGKELAVPPPQEVKAKLIDLRSTDKFQIKMPAGFDTHLITLKAQWQNNWLFSKLLPTAFATNQYLRERFHKQFVQVGKREEPSTADVVDQEIYAGKSLRITTHNVGLKGRVNIRVRGVDNYNPYELSSENANIEVPVPSSIPAGTTLTVLVLPQDGLQIKAGTVRVIAMPTEPIKITAPPSVHEKMAGAVIANMKKPDKMKNISDKITPAPPPVVTPQPITPATPVTADSLALSPVGAAYDHLLRGEYLEAEEEAYKGLKDTDSLMQSKACAIEAWALLAENKDKDKDNNNPTDLVAKAMELTKNEQEGSARALALAAVGYMYGKGGDVEKASEYFLKATDVKPNNLLLGYLALADLLGNKAKTPEDDSYKATEWLYNLLLTKGPEAGINPAIFHYKRAHFYVRQQDAARARQEYDAALQSDPALKSTQGMLGLDTEIAKMQ